MDRSLISKILLIVAVICACVAWFLAAGWVFDDGNYGAWVAGALTAYFGSRLVVEL